MKTIVVNINTITSSIIKKILIERPWILAESVWYDLGVWKDEETWND